MGKINRLRLVLFIASIALVVIPIIIVSITGRGFGELVSHILISSSILCAIAAVLPGADKKNKDKFFVKLGISIALLIVLASIWI